MSTSLQQFARALGLPGTGRTWSYDDLLNRCADAYWQNRPDFGPRCGTEPGYRDHARKHQAACAPCRRAYAEYRAANRQRVALGLPPRGRQLRPCGTHAAFGRHKARGETPCPSCDAAERQYQRVSRRRRPSPVRELRPCGTHAAFERHRMRGDDPCVACLDAERTYQRNRNRQRKAA